jgi:HTH-type transcriptional regulator/antitoxin HigA
MCGVHEMLTRERKPDIFWSSLAHEIGHLVLYAKRTTVLDLESEKDSLDPAELEADEFGERALFPGDTRDRIAQAHSRQDLALLAARPRLGVAIVAGQYGHLTNQWRVASPLRGRITDDDIDF